MSYIEVLLGIVILFFLGYTRLRTQKETVFSRGTTASLRGVAVMGIILHHIHNKCAVGTPLLAYIGFISTGIFFFISGYGNELSLNKAAITSKWIKRKFAKIYIPFWVTYVFYSIVLVFMYPHAVNNSGTILKEICTVTLPNQVTWFPKVILVVFTVHYLLKKCLKIKQSKDSLFVFGVILLGCVIYSMIMYCLEFAPYWYNSVFCYPVGILFSLCKKENNDKKAIGKNIIIFVIMFLTVFILYERKIEIWDIICAVVISVICYQYTYIFSVKCQILEWVGNNSFEFYLFHSLCLQWFVFLIKTNKVLYGTLVVAVTFLLVFIYRSIGNMFMHVRKKD